MGGDGDILDNWDPVDMLSDNLTALASMESHLEKGKHVMRKQ